MFGWKYTGENLQGLGLGKMFLDLTTKAHKRKQIEMLDLKHTYVHTYIYIYVCICCGKC